MRSIYVLTQSHCQRGATAAQEKEKIKQAVTGARVHPEAATHRRVAVMGNFVMESDVGVSRRRKKKRICDVPGRR